MNPIRTVFSLWVWPDTTSNCARQVNDVPADYYFADVAGHANPRVLRVADLTTRFRLSHRYSYTSGRPPFDMVFAPSSFVALNPAVTHERLPAYVHGCADWRSDRGGAAYPACPPPPTHTHTLPVV